MHDGTPVKLWNMDGETEKNKKLRGGGGDVTGAEKK